MKTIERSWEIENCKAEISRLQSILRDPRATQTEREIAAAQLSEYADGIESYLNRVFPMVQR